MHAAIQLYHQLILRCQSQQRLSSDTNVPVGEGRDPQATSLPGSSDIENDFPNDGVLALMAEGGSGVEAHDSRSVLSHPPEFNTHVAYSPAPLNNTSPRLRIRQALVPLMASAFSSDTIRNSLHLPAPSSSALRESSPNFQSLKDLASEQCPVDPYDLSLWQPDSNAFVAPRARDGEFERFLLDEMARIGCQDPTAYPSLLLRLKYDTNRALSCVDAWHRADVIDIRQHFYPKPLSKLILFRNHLAILRSNSKYASYDVTGALADIFDLETFVPLTDLAIIRAGNNIVAALGESILAVEGLIARLDTIITRSRNRYTCLVEELDSADELGEAAVMPSNEEGECGKDDDVADVEEVDVSSVRFPSPPLTPNDDGVIYVSD